MDDPAATDRMTGMFLRPMFRKVAAEVAAAAPPNGAVLDVGCGPGHLAIELATAHEVGVTGLDLDPAMIARAEKNAAGVDSRRRPTFVVGSVDALPFADGSFDVVVSTLSMHHWSDRETGLAEIHRVLLPGGHALIWDLKPGMHFLFHTMPGTESPAVVSTFGSVSVTPWRWPWRLSLLSKTELSR